MNNRERRFPAMGRFSSVCILVILLVVQIFPLDTQDYWQQEVAYEIHVSLNDSAHTLSAHEKLTYTNNSPDTLTFIWFHLWPNAYKNNETAYARQKITHYSTSFHWSSAKERGFIDSLDFRSNEEELEWTYHPEWIDVAKVNLSEPLPPGNSVTIETPFFVKIPKVFSRLGHTGKHYEITQWYPKPAVYDKEGWHPMPYLDMGEFYSEFGTFDVFLTLPEGYRVMATGDLINGEAEYAWLDSLAEEGEKLHQLDKKAFKKKIKKIKKAIRKAGKKRAKEKKTNKPKMKTLHFHQEKVHDFAWFADPNWIVRKGVLWLADSTHKVTLWSMYFPKNAKLWENSIAYIHDAGYWYSEFYGDYPYDHITAVDGDLSAGGGMEYPNITVISKMPSQDILEFVIMHEVGHNWFYGILGSNERDHAWLDEGLNEYTNIRYWEKKYPERNGGVIMQDFTQNKLGIAKNLDMRWIMGYLGYQQRAVSADDQPIDITSTEFHPGNYGSIVYGKTAIFTRYLQHYLGEEKINEIMQEYYENWKFKHPSPQNLREIFKKHLTENISWYLDDAIFDTKVIDYSIGELTKETVTLTNEGTMSPPVELVFLDRKGTELQRQWIPGFQDRQVVTIPEGTVRVVIDPDNYMPDINRENNTTSKPWKLNLVFDQPLFHYREVNIVPWLNGNAYNGTTPGLILYSGFIPGYRYGISLSPQWDFENNHLVGTIRAQKTFYRWSRFKTVNLSTVISDYSGRKGLKITFQGVVRKPIVATPSSTINVALFYHNIDSLAVNPLYYTAGKYVIGEWGAAYNHRPDPFLNYGGKINLKGDLKNGSFAKISFSGNLFWKYSKKLNLGGRFWIGSFLNNQDIPAQYQIWMSGGVDPDFENSFVFNRTDDGGVSPVNVYDEEFIQEGPSMRGAYPTPSKKTAWAVNFNHSVPLVPLNLFLDLGKATDLKNTLIDGGLKISLSVFSFYFPLYQSWEEESKVPSNLDWIVDRARFEFSLPSGIRVGG